MLFLLMGSILTYVCQTYLELYSEKGGGIAKQRIAPIFTPFACVQLIIVHMTENTPHQCVRKDSVERMKPRKIYAAFSIFAQHKGVEGEGKGWKRYRHFSHP